MMKTRLVAIVVMWLLLGIVPAVDGQSDDSGWIFVYWSYTEDERQLHWIDLDSGIEGAIAVPDSQSFTLSPTRPMVAFTSTNQVYVLDISNRDLLDTGVIISDDIEVIYGVRSIRSASLRWSPAGDEVAFIGYTEDDRVTVYVYEPDTQQLTNITPDILFREDFVDISSWSPDGRWLTIAGSWGENRDFRSAVLARDGSAFIEFEPRTCEVRWSPNMDYLVSEASCYESFHDALPLLLFTFDSTQPRIEQLPPLVGADTQTQYVQYRFPLWLNNDVLAISRFTGTRGVNLTSDDFSNDIIHYDVTRHELIPIPDTRTESSWEIIYGNWLLLWYSDHLAAYRMVDNRHESILVTRLMPVSYISISSDDRFVVLLDDTDLPGDSHIRIIDIMTHETLLEIAPQYHEALIPIGFVPNGQ